MIPDIAERLAKLEKRYNEDVDAEWITDDFLKTFPILSTHITYLNNYPRSAFIIVKAEDFYIAELEFIPRISTQFSVKWRKSIEESGISYQTRIKLDNRTYHITIEVRASDTCTITKRATGRITQESVWTDVPEYEYQIDCA